MIEVTHDILRLMFLYWADWQHRDLGGIRVSDEPPQKIYHGSEPIPDTIWLIESTLAYMRQTREGLRCAEVLKIHYLRYNAPVQIRCDEVAMAWKLPRGRRIAPSTYQNLVKVARVLALDSIERLQAGDKLDIKAVIARDRPG